MSMFGPKIGTWWINSKSDPRWNDNGRAKGLTCAGGPAEMHEALERKKKKLGQPPKDLKLGFMKD